MHADAIDGAAAVDDKPTLRDRLLAVRDHMVTRPGFRRWAASFPLTRPIARRRARALFDLCAGFVYTQVLTACVRLDLFAILVDGPLDRAVIARRLALSPDAADRLLRAAASLRLVERRRGGRFGLGPLGAALIGNHGLVAMIEHHAMLYADLRDPVALLRGETRGETALGAYWPYASDAAGARDESITADRIAPYTKLMAASQPLIADEVLAAYRFGKHRCLLDIGGGDGSFLLAVAPRAPKLRLMLFDLPPVAARAGARFASAGLSGRSEAIGGDFRTDPLPRGADIISLVRVVHDHDLAIVQRLLRAAFDALPDGGTLLIAEPMAGAAGAEPIGDAYFGFYLLAMGSGRARPPSELRTLLQQAGFVDAREIRTHTPLLTGVIVARKPLSTAAPTPTSVSRD